MPKSRSARLHQCVALLLVGAIVFSVNLPTLLAQAKKKTARGKAAAGDAESPAPSAKGKRKGTVENVEGVGNYSSRNFALHTDLSADEAQELLKRLETMLGLISKYWGRPPVGTIDMYVVKELRNWPNGAFPPEGLASIQSQAGVTMGRTLSRGEAFVSKAVVYAIADHGTPQHEAVHAYCIHAFGRTGPVWYAEGMAEMGQYWKTDDSSVNAHDVVIDYLRNSEPKSLNEIVNGQEWTGDSWQNYAWRWALCHLLANNPNYASRFRPLGLGLLTKQDVSFGQTYGDMAKEISFEYRQFLEHLEAGHRVDLCGWDWKAKFKPVKTSAITTVKIDAGKGWQASRLVVNQGETYEYSASGTWTTAKGADPVTANGTEGGAGKLVGALLSDENGDYRLSAPFELGEFGTFTAPGDGNLVLRCQDAWNSLADNKGSLTIKLKLEGKGNPLPSPESEKKSARTGKKADAEASE